MARPDVHLAQPDDATEITRIQRETWRTAYGDIVGDDAIAMLDDPGIEQRWSEAIAHPDTDVFVATEGSFTVGFTVSGQAPEDELAGPNGELPDDAAHTGLIATVLVEPRWGRRGHGGRLLAAAARALRSRGAQRAITWVSESDSATLAFYRSIGWDPDGTVRTLDTGGARIREMRLAGGLELHLKS
ncbi:GNAT family N-acetyltransferase [Haloechinothrix halophila]|uniref:GNAT family N-acetyltransferase n=1 Tax=Haloechinothrix halophila TaxID=1069073 RepID=UPI0004055804|nr:GNAT family N-acetyltransferase [Haloechinothrix halophila]